ncbi:hypothetical protein [Flavobacterium sp. UBA6135]|uniref:hypothetical protein n=1 Tax=Flavobacterium sp. UBA6135 TaxID=1946553 RepID=UPI0025C37A55|nr:hypothetical protein [Flavobacterium sp. UBA6135]
MDLKKTVIIALCVGFVAIGSWELFWRSKGYFPDLDDDKHLWARNRAKVDKAISNDVVLVGSSRVLFDIQLKEWKALTGIQPIQLANAGASPLPVFNDIVENSNFNGTVIVGVTPPLFFSTTYPQAPPWSRASSRTKFFHDRTYAQRWNYSLSVPLQNTFAFLSDDEEGWYDDINLKALLKTIKMEKRTTQPDMPPFYRFQDIDSDRNVRMKQRVVTDTAFAGSIKKVWKFFMMADMPPPDKDGTIAFFLKDLEKFQARGGKVILVRLPSSGFFHDLETNVFSRKDYWDVLVSQAGVPAYHYTDYEPLTGFDTPEWSHLSGPDASVFTERFVNILLKENVIPTSKTN